MLHHSTIIEGIVNTTTYKQRVDKHKIEKYLWGLTNSYGKTSLYMN